ncbi:hypothetical protein ABZ023_23450 [Streptomyces sp. NPDC006367]|uniref:hypothetical protein n=1 Tax=unclassified Streptomyces TaxID=2593676 RepID=UPI0033AF1E0D
MGYWGYFVVSRAERPLTERDGPASAADMTLRASAPDGWRVWEYPGGEGDVGNMNDLAARTGAPALFGYVMDSACVVIEAAAPESGAWTTCLVRTAMAGYLGAEREGLTLEDYFLEPRDAAERAVAWAAEAGRTADAGELTEVLSAGLRDDAGGPSGDAAPTAEDLFFRFLDRLGVVPL